MKSKQKSVPSTNRSK